MKISELIEELNRLKDEHGDLEVKFHYDEYGVDIDIDVVSKEIYQEYVSISQY